MIIFTRTPGGGRFRDGAFFRILTEKPPEHDEKRFNKLIITEKYLNDLYVKDSEFHRMADAGILALNLVDCLVASASHRVSLPRYQTRALRQTRTIDFMKPHQ
jgi:hypothetical protein